MKNCAFFTIRDKIKQKNNAKKPPTQTVDGFLVCNALRLFSFEAVATSTTFRIAVTRIAYVDFTKGAIITRAVVLAIGYTATDCRVDVLSIFVHHIKKPPLKVQAVYANIEKIIDIFKNLM